MNRAMFVMSVLGCLLFAGCEGGNRSGVVVHKESLCNSEGHQKGALVIREADGHSTALGLSKPDWRQTTKSETEVIVTWQIAVSNHRSASREIHIKIFFYNEDGAVIAQDKASAIVDPGQTVQVKNDILLQKKVVVKISRLSVEASG